ncbi:HK97 family phage prohead protease [Pelagibacterium mangrovi]|uniref:HK97 family phage prohead protease n=1 Tax=Pelagibacterium mangrovi TaxID=3119828 RepID=UPI002FCAD121
MKNDPVQLVAHPDRLDCEVRFSSLSDDGAIEGLAVKFDVVDTYRTSFDRRAFAWDGKSLPLLWSHNPSDVVGSIRSVAVESEGLRIRGKLNLDVAKAREVRSLLMAGDIGGLSIGFRRIKDESRAGGVRHITQAQLVEVSFVAVPSVPGSGVTSVRIHNPETGHASTVAFVNACRSASARMEKLK